MKIIAVIPARMNSTRFPGKPLAPILGIPMIEHVRRRVALSSIFCDVVVATCDEEIKDIVIESGGTAIMTDTKHERCTDRVAEAVERLDADIIVNVQGDEPLVVPDMFLPLVKPLLEDQYLNCVNLMTEVTSQKEFLNKNVVKVVCDLNENAMFFSREPIPSEKMSPKSSLKKYKQLGIYGFRKQFLFKLTKLAPTPLEITESVDMLRLLENGYSIRMVKSNKNIVGVDTPADLEIVTKIMKSDALINQYS